MGAIQRSFQIEAMLNEMLAAGKTIDQAESDLIDEVTYAADEWRDEHEGEA